MKIKLYGREACHKTKYYKTFFKARHLDYEFLEVEDNNENTEELRNLYENKKLNSPTITVDNKRLRNPSNKELQKWIA